MFGAGILATYLLYKLITLSRQNTILMGQISRMYQDLDQKLFHNNDTIERKLSSTSQNLFSLSQNLSELQTSHRHIKELRDELTSLNAVLHTPKLRGNLGELMLEEMLRNYFPPSRFALQHAFPSGVKVDACLFLEDQYKLCIDAKFPLENYRKAIESQENNTALLGAFKRDVKKHITDIQSKYIIPSQKTLGFALMYIPSETIYYELIARKEFADVLPFAYDQGVLPVSPSTLFSYIQILLLGFKGLQVEQHAERILLAMEQLESSIQTFSDGFDKMGRHLTNANNVFAENRRQLDKIELVSGSLKELDTYNEEPVETSEPEFIIRQIPIEK